MHEQRTEPRSTHELGATGDGSTEARTSTRRAFLVASGAGAAVSLAGCIGGASGGGKQAVGTASGDGTTTGTTDATTTTKRPLKKVVYRGRFKRVGLAPAVNDAGIHFGTWRDQGLDVSYETASGGQAAAKSVASGKDPFGNAGISSVLQLVEQGAPLRIIGQIADPMSGVVALEKQGVHDWTDLEGKRVGAYPFGSTGPAAKAAMRKAGVDLSKVEFRNVQPGSGLKLLLDGTIDAMVKYFPQMQTRLEYEGYSATVLKTSDVLHHLGVALFTRTDVIDDHPEEVDAFVKGWLKAFTPWTTKLDQVIEIYKPLAVGEFDVALEKRTVPALYASQAPPKSIGLTQGKGWTSPEKLEHTIEVFEDAGMIQGTVDPDVAYTNRFIDRNQELAIDAAKHLYTALDADGVSPDYV